MNTQDAITAFTAAKTTNDNTSAAFAAAIAILTTGYQSDQDAIAKAVADGVAAGIAAAVTAATDPLNAGIATREDQLNTLRQQLTDAGLAPAV